MVISLPLDQIQSSYKFARPLISPTLFKQRIRLAGKFSLRRRRYRAPIVEVRCSLLGDGLRPRPMPKSRKKVEKSKEEEMDPQKSNLVSGISAQIEKLVLCKRYDEALELLEILELQGDFDVSSDTYDALVGACIALRSIRGVKRVLGHMLNSEMDMDLYMMNRVLLMHVKCGMMIDARKLFEDMPERNLDSWNMIIGGLVDSGDYLDAFRLFLLMWEDNSNFSSRILATMFRASARLELISPGQQLHSYSLKMGVCDDVFISCALIDMYSKCGSIEDARFVFDVMPEKTTVAWNIVIAGYALHGYSEEALSLYYEMQDSGVKTDHFTYSTIIKVCTRLASLQHARQAHAGLIQNGIGYDVAANTALVDFYSKWGRIEDARNVFDRMPLKNVRSWNALIFGYGNHGRGSEAVDLFERMVHQGMVPNHVTFLAVLSSCCHSGLSGRGWEIFESMSRDYKVKPRAMHYACMVELLGREGLLDDALTLIRDAPFKASINMWAALLTGCRVHKNFELGKYAAEKLYGMEPEKLSNYVVLLNVYRCSGKLEEAAALLRTLRRRGLRMQLACTWVEIKKQQYVFLTGDKSHPQTKEIYDNLDEMMLQLSKHGFVPRGKNLLPDVDEREESLLHHHSEKLAISFGLISTASSTPLQLVQSHRICNDCHDAIKLISTVYKREIAFRDGSRFHHFEDGRCSCGDYW